MLNAANIKSLLTAKRLGSKLELFDMIEHSTNDHVAGLLSQGEGVVTAALLQQGGRGRVGRAWKSGNIGESLALSFSICPQLPITDYPMITLAAALSVYDAIGVDFPCIKWPNDILFDGKKACGILTELRSFEGKNYAVVGIGINIFQQSFPLEIAKKATSLAIAGAVADSDINREGFIEGLIARILNAFEGYMEIIEKDGDFSELVDIYKSRLLGLDERVKILDFSDAGEDASKARLVIEGSVTGINNSGALTLIDDEGVKHTIIGGELSLRGGFYE